MTIWNVEVKFVLFSCPVIWLVIFVCVSNEHEQHVKNPYKKKQRLCIVPTYTPTWGVRS